MMQFRFQLTPLEEVAPWSDSPPKQHWFGLTDGWFWIEVGNQELFRYSDAILKYWEESGRPPNGLPYSWYFVVRYWEDLQGMIGAILDPLPDDFAALVADAFAWNTWQEKAERWLEQDDDGTRWETYYAAIGWWSNRNWDAGHLNEPPRIYLWRHHDTIFIRWDNRGLCIDEIPVWPADYGSVSLSVTEFLEAVYSFDSDLIQAMQERVETIRTANPLPHIFIDVDALKNEHEQRRGWLAKALQRSHDSSWDEARAAMEIIEHHSKS